MNVECSDSVLSELKRHFPLQRMQSSVNLVISLKIAVTGRISYKLLKVVEDRRPAPQRERSAARKHWRSAEEFWRLINFFIRQTLPWLGFFFGSRKFCRYSRKALKQIDYKDLEKH